MFRAITDIVLASASPRRRDLLQSLGIDFSVAPGDVNEPSPDTDERPERYAKRLAALKARAVARHHPDACVIGADTVVCLDSRILGKPVDTRDARRMLQDLCGQTRDHTVVTGCCIVARKGFDPEKNGVGFPTIQAVRIKDRWESVFAVATIVRMRAQQPGVIESYIHTQEPEGKAGAYAIQGHGAFLVEGIQGSYTNVVGLPLAEVVEVLASWGFVLPRIV